MKIDRLIGILSILLQKEMTTAPELAEHFEVSRRTINRDIEALCKAGIPIQTTQGVGGGISIMSGYRMDRTILTSRDMQVIMAGLRSLDSVSGSSYYSQLMEKIQAGSSELVSGKESMLIDLSSWYKATLAPKISMIQDAIETRHLLKFKYFAPSGESVRNIEPYYIVFKWNSWYVYGWCRKRKDFRLFKLNRMDKLTETTDVENARGIWESKGVETGVAFIDMHPASQYLEEEPLLGSGTYKYSNYDSIPDGAYYTTIFHFADGGSVMTNIKQK